MKWSYHFFSNCSTKRQKIKHCRVFFFAKTPTAQNIFNNNDAVLPTSSASRLWQIYWCLTASHKFKDNLSGVAEFLSHRRKARLETCDNIQHIWRDHNTKTWTKSHFKQCGSRFMATTHQTTEVSGKTRNASFYYVYRKMSLWLWHRFDKVVKRKAGICEDMTFFSFFFVSCVNYSSD